MNDVKLVECDEELRRRVGTAMGPVAERHIRLEDGFAFVAMDAGSPVGLIAVYRRRLPDPLSQTDEGFINIIEVADAYRRHGIGRRLVEKSIERCRAQGLHQIRAWSSTDKAAAIHLWKALGFALCPASTYSGGVEVKGYFAARLL